MILEKKILEIQKKIDLLMEYLQSPKKRIVYGIKKGKEKIKEVEMPALNKIK